MSDPLGSGIELVIDKQSPPVTREVIPPMCTLNEPAAPASTAQALAMVPAGLGTSPGVTPPIWAPPPKPRPSSGWSRLSRSGR